MGMFAEDSFFAVFVAWFAELFFFLVTLFSSTWQYVFDWLFRMLDADLFHLFDVMFTGSESFHLVLRNHI